MLTATKFKKLRKFYHKYKGTVDFPKNKRFNKLVCEHLNKAIELSNEQ